MSRVVRIDIEGSLDGATPAVYTAPAFKDENGVLVLAVVGDAGVFPLVDLLNNLGPGGETPDQFFPRIEFTASDLLPPFAVPTVNAMGAGLVPGQTYPMVERAVEDLLVSSHGGLRVLSPSTGPHKLYFNMCDIQTACELLTAACCTTDLPVVPGPPVRPEV